MDGQYNQFARTRLLLGEEALQRLARAHAAIFGIGGVGGYVTEALARSGIGHFTLIDSDTVALSNLNRQIIATYETLGRRKTEVMKERILSINPAAQVEVRDCFFLPENADTFDFSHYSYVIDAVDTVTAKLEIIVRAQKAGVPVISSMGTGNKLDPSRLRISDIYETRVDPLARVMRRELRKRGVKALTVVWSEEEPIRPGEADGAAGRTVPAAEPGGDTPGSRRSVPGSTAFVPSSAGLLIASHVVRELALKK